MTAALSRRLILVKGGESWRVDPQGGCVCVFVSEGVCSFKNDNRTFVCVNEG